MIFNSLDFFLFLPIVYLLYRALPLVGRQLLLIAASLFFYMYWNVPYVGLMLGSAFVDYLLSLRLGVATGARERRLLVTISVLVNLGILAFFKYYNFFLDTLDTVSGTSGWLPESHFLLPLGISFYTFQTMSYTIDVYRGRLEPEKNPLKVLLYVSFFPQLVAGPIERADHLLPQLGTFQRTGWDDLIAGSQRILVGLVKKVVIADNVSRLVDPVYADPSSFSAPFLLLATYAFAVQIFCDFAGYSDIAIGTARLFGFRLRENFDSPYLSRSIQEFWRRWHISLSSWLRDYLYIPLGGNRKGPSRTYVNLAITMLLGGLWHGASWNFVIWGAIHGVWLGVERFVTRHERWPAASSDGWTPVGVLKMVAVFHGVCVAWVFFRARTLEDALTVLSRTASLGGGASLNTFNTLYTLMVAAVGCGFFALLTQRHRGRWVWWLAGVYGLVAIVVFGVSSSEFIYFVF